MSIMARWKEQAELNPFDLRFEHPPSFTLAMLVPMALRSLADMFEREAEDRDEAHVEKGRRRERRNQAGKKTRNAIAALAAWATPPGASAPKVLDYDSLVAYFDEIAITRGAQKAEKAFDRIMTSAEPDDEGATLTIRWDPGLLVTVRGDFDLLERLWAKRHGDAPDKPTAPVPVPTHDQRLIGIASRFATSSQLLWDRMLCDPETLMALSTSKPEALRDAFRKAFADHGVQWATAEATLRGRFSFHGVTMAETEFGFSPASLYGGAPSPLRAKQTPDRPAPAPTQVGIDDAVQVASLWLSHPQATRMDAAFGALTQNAIRAFNEVGALYAFQLADVGTVHSPDWPEATPEGNPIDLREKAQSFTAMLNLQGIAIPLDHTHPERRPTGPKLETLPPAREWSAIHSPGLRSPLGAPAEPQVDPYGPVTVSAQAPPAGIDEIDDNTPF